MPSLDEYTIGWISALPVEMAAAKLILDQIHPKLPQPSHDKNSYIYGEVVGHNVVVACLPSGVYGTNAAGVVAQQMLSTFPSIRFGVMVGIGGGVPSESADIRLGDVVVSKPEGKLPGVVQYDYGKTISNGRFERIGSLDKPPPIVLKALANMQADHILGESRFEEYMSESLKRKEASNSIFKRPGPDEDQLFNASHDHDPSRSSCSNCDHKQSVSREPRMSQAPVVHYGTIASGNQVMKHGRTRDRIARRLGGVLCFEMEAAGLMNDFPCIVIRGICDYCDSHKNKQWQGYAALSAAAYTKEFLSHVSITEVSKQDHNTLNRVDQSPRNEISYLTRSDRTSLISPDSAQDFFMLFLCVAVLAAMVPSIVFLKSLSTSSWDSIAFVIQQAWCLTSYWALLSHWIERWKGILLFLGSLVFFEVHHWIISVPTGYFMCGAYGFLLLPVFPMVMYERIH